MNKLERYFFALLGLVILVLLIVVIYMMYYPTPRYTGYGPDYYNQPGGMMGRGGMMGSNYEYPYGVSDVKTEFSSNGERIYYTGYNESGEKIPFSYGPTWLYFHGGSCVNCHGVDGKGGVPIMMAYKIPPDITYDSLTSEEHEMEEGEEHVPYTNETLRIAIKEGIEPSGEEMDPAMPRWDMSDEDLNDTMAYLQQL